MDKELTKLIKEIKRLKKDKEFMAELNKFIKETTGGESHKIENYL